MSRFTIRACGAFTAKDDLPHVLRCVRRPPPAAGVPAPGSVADEYLSRTSVPVRQLVPAVGVAERVRRLPLREVRAAVPVQERATEALDARLAREERPALQTISMCTENRGGADASVASRFLIEASLGRKANDADADPTWRNNLPPMLPDAPATHFPGFAARSGNSSFHFAHTSSKNGDLSLVRSATIESSISPAHADGVLNAGTSPSTGREKSTDAIPRSRFAAALALRLKYGSYIRVE